MKQLMLGNEAVARGIYEAGCALVFSYPGTPSTEITEYAAKYSGITAEWSPNEKVALEAAIGASMVGARAFCAMKHVGLNVAADPLFTLAYTGVSGGLVIAVADDPGMHSSQNEQDTRSVAAAARVPVLEPADSAECRELTILAFEISERFDVPVIIRLTTRIAHSRSLVETGEARAARLEDYQKNPQKNVMVPANARGRRVNLEERMAALLEYSEKSGINTVEEGEGIGIIASGVCRLYAREGAPEGSGVLSIRMSYPLPDKLIKEFASGYKNVVVAEELDAVIETRCKVLGVDAVGKDIFPAYGEYSQRMIAEKLRGETPEYESFGDVIPLRPPVLCAGCTHRGVFYVLCKLDLFVSGDIGCYTLAAAPPLSAIDTTVCMGASVSGLHGVLKARPDWSKRAVAVIGDSTFLHSGVTGLIDIVYNQSNATVIILDNATTGMTGHQHNPSTGFDVRGNSAPVIDLEALCLACGVKRVAVVDPYDLDSVEKSILEELSAAEPSVIIMKRPCALLKSSVKGTPYRIEGDKCRGCKKCLALGCPAICMSKTAAIEENICFGCGMCKCVCPFGAIVEVV